MNHKRKSVDTIFLMALLLLSCLSFLQFKTVKSQEPEPVTYRGSNYIDTNLGLLPSGLEKHTWTIAPLWIESGGEYVPYIFQDNYNSDGYYQVQSGLIGAKLFDYYAEFYSPDMKEVRLYDERWEVHEWTGKKWSDIGAQSGTPLFTISQEENKIEISKSFSSWAGILTIDYIFNEGEPLKHKITFNSTLGGMYRVVQNWAGIVASNNVKHDDGEDTIFSATIINSSIFIFIKDNGDLSIYENQWDMVEYLEPVEIDIHAQGLKADYVFSNWTLSQGELLEIDPATSTLNNPTVDGYVIEGAGKSEAGDFVRMGRYQTTGPRYAYGYVEWSISSISDGATISNVEFRYEGKTDNDPDDSRIVEMTGCRPSTTGFNDIVTWITSADTYIDPWNPTVATNQAQDLGSDADTDLQNSLSGDWFAIGFGGNHTSTNGYDEFYSEEYASTPDPTLYIEYELIPTITSATITDMDDTDNCYEMKQYYTFEVVVDDADGADTIANVSLRVQDGSTKIMAEVMAATLDGTPAYSIVSNSSEIDIDADSCGWSEAGDVGTATFKIRFEWDFTDTADLELYVMAADEDNNSLGWAVEQTNYFDVIGRLVTTGLATNGTFIVGGMGVQVTGNVYYANTTTGNVASSFYPLDAQFTDIAVHNATHDEEATDTTIVNGAFSIDFSTLSVVGTYTYHIYIDGVADYTDADAPDGDTFAIYVITAALELSFDDETGSTSEDSGGYNNDGTISSATRTGEGIYGRALSFDGTDDYVTVSDSATLNITGSLALVAWIKTSDTGVQGIICKTDAYGLTIMSNYGVRFTINTTHLDTSPNAFTANTWTYIVGVYNTSQMLIYIDGVFVTNRTTSGVVNINDNNLFIGNITTNFLNGTLDEVRVLDYAPTLNDGIAEMRWDPIATFPYNLQTVITTMDAGDWVFADEDYTFTGTYVRQNASYTFDSFGLRFTDGASYATMTFDGVTDEFDVSASIVYEMTNTNSSSSNEWTIAWEVYIIDTIYDSLDVDIEMFCNDTLGNSDGYEIVETDYFNIYNVGGQTEYDNSGDGGSVSGQGVFALAAQNSSETGGSWATANITWRKLQRVNFLVHIWSNTAYNTSLNYWECPTEHANTGYVEYGINYYYDDSWLEGWKVRIEVDDGDAGGHGLGTDDAWILVNCSWYNRESFVKSDTFYAYYEAIDSNDVTTQFALHVDLWVDIAESSSMVGGRVNAEYFGMNETGWGPWSSWSPIYGMADESVFSDDLLDDTGLLAISAQGLDMFSAWAKINKTSDDSGDPGCDSHQWALIDYNGPYWQRLSPFEVMTGISPPQRVDTITPGETPSGFFAGLIAAMIDGITKPIVNALTAGQQGLWFMVETAINIPFEWFGIVGAVDLLTTYISGFVTYFATSLTNVVLLIVQIFTLINNISSFVITWLTNFVSMFVRISTIVVSILDGTHSVASGLGNVWDTMAWDSWSDGVPVFVAIAWMYSLDNRARRMGGGWITLLWGDISIVMGIVGYLLNMFSFVIDVVLGTIFRIMGAIGG